MWILQMNDMRFPKIEMLAPVTIGKSIDELKQFIDSQRVPHYREDGWGKGFKKGGPLEWCNDIFLPFESQHFVELLSIEELMEEYKDA